MLNAPGSPGAGDPTEAVLAGLRGAEAAFGADVNSRGFRVPRGCGVIQVGAQHIPGNGWECLMEGC